MLRTSQHFLKLLFGVKTVLLLQTQKKKKEGPLSMSSLTEENLFCSHRIQNLLFDLVIIKSTLEPAYYRAVFFMIFI